MAKFSEGQRLLRANNEPLSYYRLNLATALRSVELAVMWEHLWVLQQMRGREGKPPDVGVRPSGPPPILVTAGRRYVFWPPRQAKADLPWLQDLSAAAVTRRLQKLIERGLVVVAETPAESDFRGAGNDAGCWYAADQDALDNLCPLDAADGRLKRNSIPIQSQASQRTRVSRRLPAPEPSECLPPILSDDTPQKCGYPPRASAGTHRAKMRGVHNKEEGFEGTKDQEERTARARAGGGGSVEREESTDAAVDVITPTFDDTIAALRSIRFTEGDAVNQATKAADPQRVVIVCDNARDLDAAGYPFTSSPRAWALGAIFSPDPVHRFTPEEVVEKVAAAKRRAAAQAIQVKATTNTASKEGHSNANSPKIDALVSSLPTSRHRD